MAGATAGGTTAPTSDGMSEWLDAFGRSVAPLATMQYGVIVADGATLRILGANRRARELLCGECSSIDAVVEAGRLSRRDADAIAKHAGEAVEEPAWSIRVRSHRTSAASEDVSVVGSIILHPSLSGARVVVMLVCAPGDEDVVADYRVELGAPDVLHFVYDREIRIVSADPRLRRYGINPESQVGLIAWPQVHPADIPIAQRNVFELVSGRADVVEYTIRVASPATGMATPVRVELRRLVTADGVEDHVLATLRPVGDAKRVVPVDRLTPRELAIVVELFDGRRIPQIAARAGLSPKTIRNQLSGVFRKLGVASQTELLDGFEPPPRADVEAH